MPKSLPFLKVDKTKIVDEAGKPVRLRGVALGGWLMMEGYMLYGRNIPERAFRESFERALGKDALEDFTKSFRDTFITEEDIRIIKDWAASCIRVPFNYRLVEFENRPFSLDENGLGYLDRIVDWCGKHGLYCILDMHAAPGAQNPDWHADCSGEPQFFADAFNQDRYLRLWRFLAGRYKDASAIAGYDVLNEPVVKFNQDGIVKDLYERVTKEIRDVDKNHIIFLEGTGWGVHINFLGKPKDENTAYSIHTYVPPEYVFNWETDLHYPGKFYNINWNRKTIDFLAKPYRKFMEEHAAPLYVGEFGINWREGHFGELRWVRDMLYLFKKHDFHWCYWTYKTVANPANPDGIYRYVKNSPWVNRKGPVSGWETFAGLWPRQRNNIINSWKTKEFVRNDKLLSVLKSHF